MSRDPRASHQALAAEWSPTALATADRLGALTFVNSVLRRMLPDARIGAPLAVLADADGAAALAAAMGQVLGRSPPRPASVDLTRAGTPPAVLRYTLAPLPKPSGAAGGVVIAIQDITATTGVARQLEEAQRLHAVGQMAGGLAHDFNNLLTAILAATDSLAAHGLDPEGQADARTIREAAERGAALIAQLLSIGRQDALQPRRLDAATAVGALARLLKRSLPEGVRIATDLEPGGLPVVVDPSALDRIVINLAVNAGQAMPRGGTVVLRAVRTTLLRPLAAGPEQVPAGVWAEIAVQDDGPGMPPDVLANIFQPFFTTRRTAGGTGLGLATVQGLARQSGGHVVAESTMGSGTLMRVLLPPAPAAPPPAPATLPPARAASPPRTILFVDDEDAVRRVMGRALRQAGFAVLDAADADQAEAAVAQAAVMPDVVVTDMMMPGRSGDALVHDLRARLPGLPAVLASGYAERGLPADLLAQPGTRWLGKPYTVAQLTAAVRELFADQESDLGS